MVKAKTGDLGRQRGKLTPKTTHFLLVVVDDHPLVRQGIVTVLRRNPDLEVVAEGGCGADAARLVAVHRPVTYLL